MIVFRDVAPVIIVGIIVLGVVVSIKMSKANDARKATLKLMAEKLDLAREQLSLAKKALTTEASTGSMNAQLALEDIQNLQNSFDEQSVRKLG